MTFKERLHFIGVSFMHDTMYGLFMNAEELLIPAGVKEGQKVLEVGCGPGFFTIDMANMVGPNGRVIAVDLQPVMLERVRRKAVRHGVADRMTFHQCREHDIGLAAHADFILVYYMLHETPNPARFLAETRTLLKDGGRILVVEPKFHVSQKQFDTLMGSAETSGLKILAFPSKKGGRSALFTV